MVSDKQPDKKSEDNLEDSTEQLRVPEEKIEYFARILSKQIDQKVFERKYAPAKEVLKLVGAGAFLAVSLVAPNLPRALKPFLKNENEFEVWKRFNIPYLKRTVQRLEKQKLVEIEEQDGKQTVKITENGRKRVLKYALEELVIEKPDAWDGKWRLVSFDLPEKLAKKRKILVEYLRVWGFYPMHKSVYLHAYPCLDEVDFLREILGIDKYVRMFAVSEIENEKSFRDFFGV